MPRSMTGFGRATGVCGDETLTIEISAVNHRFLDCSFRLPSVWSTIEPALRDAVKTRIARGKLNVYVGRQRGGNGRQRVVFDEEAAAQYVEASRELMRLMSTTQAVSIDTIAQLEGVFVPEEEEADLEAITAALSALVGEAADQLNTMRDTEGRALGDALQDHIAVMREALDAIEAQAPELNTKYEERLRERVKELAADAAVAEERVALEVALMAEKNDVSEEIVRLKSHFDHVMEHLESDGPVGRELNFLTQEIQREANTLGSKLRDIGVSREILRIKTELEKFREQVQNVE